MEDVSRGGLVSSFFDFNAPSSGNMVAILEVYRGPLPV